MNRILMPLSLVLMLILASCTSNQVYLEAVWEGEDQGQGQFDLDTGEFAATGGGDIRLYAGAGSALFVSLDPENGAKAAPFGTSKPSQEDCSQVLQDTLGGLVPEIFEGNYICVETNENRIASVLVTERVHSGEQGMRIKYFLWPRQGD